jgi:DNA-binding CsgD family transcriptional regulator/tetratricopeptide (TPR) repeat protein
VSVFPARDDVPGEGFVGRARELAVLRGLVAGLAGGRGGVVWVEGEPGIGKSALVRAGLAGARGLGCAVFAGAGDRLREGLPLGAMLDCLDVSVLSADRFRVEIARVLRGERAGGASAGAAGRGRADGGPGQPGLRGPAVAGDPVAVAGELLCELVDELCTVSPVLVVVDDMQWADEASVMVWQRLAVSARVAPLGVVGVARPTPRRTTVGEVRQRVGDLGGTAIALGGLADAEVAELVAGLLGARPGPRLAALAGRAGGSPLYVRELLDALVREDGVRTADGLAEVAAGAAAPGSLGAAIEGRLGFLSERALHALREASLLGEEFAVADLAVVTGSSVRGLAGVVREAVASGVLADLGSGLAFRHALIREALVEGTPTSLRAGLHREAARALAAAGAAEEKVAAQLTAALALEPADGLSAWAVGWLAGHAAELARRAPTTTAGLLASAVASAASDGSRQVLREHLAELLLLGLARYEEAAAIARELTDTVSDPEPYGHAAWILVSALLRMGIRQSGQAIEAVQRALAVPGLPPRWEARLRALSAASLANAGRDDEVSAMAGSALETAKQLGDSSAAGTILHALATSAFRKGELAAAISHMDRALAIMGDDHEIADQRLNVMNNRLGLRSMLGQDIEADARRMIELSQPAGIARGNQVRTTLAAWLHEAGRWDEALAEMAPVYEPGASTNPQVLAFAHGLAALIAVSRDDQAAIDVHLAAGDIPGLDLGLGQGGNMLRASALAAERAGRPAEAVSILAPALDPDAKMAPVARLAWLGVLVRCALAADDGAAAAAGALRCAELADRSPLLPWITMGTLRCRGLADGDPQMLEQAAAGYRELVKPYHQAEALEDLAVVLAARGELARGRAALRNATEIYAGLGAEWDIRRADARARAHGVRRRRGGATRRPASGWEALTPAEQRIAFLAAERLSNREIAGRMSLSAHTVRFYLSSIMAKLGVHSRVEVGQEASRHLRDDGGRRQNT